MDGAWQHYLNDEPIACSLSTPAITRRRQIGVAFFGAGRQHLKVFRGPDMNMTRALKPMSVILVLSITVVRADTSADAEKVALANLRALGHATLMYAQDNRGDLPSNVGALVENRYVRNAKILVDPRLKADAAAGEAAPARPNELAAEHSDFRLVPPPGGKMHVIQDSASIPLWVSKVDPATGRLLICFIDGHVQAFQSAVAVPPAIPSK